MSRLALLLPLLLAACLQAGASPAARPAAPSPDEAQLEAAATAAYGAYVGALAEVDGSRLAGVFAGPALSGLETRVEHLRLLHESQQLEPASERVVHWSGRSGAGGAVLEVQGRERLVIAGRPTGWDSYAEQWALTLTWRQGWLVVGAEDLAPADWWPA